MRILVVDDNPGITESLMMQITLLGHRVETASDGYEAIHLLENNKYDIVITDGYMPKMTGFRLCRYIRSNLPSVYVIGITGTFDLKEFRKAGADVCLQKPFAFRHLRKVIEGRSLPIRPSLLSCNKNEAI